MNELKKRRSLLGLSQSAIAKMLKVHYQTILNIEMGRGRSWHAQRYERLLRVLEEEQIKKEIYADTESLWVSCE
jgi:DNA-binding XRE family transcriptional regulator